MATIDWEFYCDTPAWVSGGVNNLVFSGSATDHTLQTTLGFWQNGTHLGDGSPGNDQCGTNHVPNVKYVSSTQFDGGSGTEVLNDTNLAATECTLRISFTNATAVAVSNARFYCFDGTTETDPAVEIEAYAFERGVSATQWTQICDYSAGIGGDNSGERLDLDDHASATEHYWYVGLSVRPETVGAKTDFEFGYALTYS